MTNNNHSQITMLPSSAGRRRINRAESRHLPPVLWSRPADQRSSRPSAASFATPLRVSGSQTRPQCVSQSQMADRGMSISAGKLRQHTETTSTRGQLGYGPGSSHAGSIGRAGSAPSTDEMGAQATRGSYGRLTDSPIGQMRIGRRMACRTGTEIQAAGLSKPVWSAAALSTRGQAGRDPASSHAGLVLSDVRFEAFLPF